MEFYNINLKEVFHKLKSSDEGLTQEEAQIRLEKFGHNELKSKKKISPLKIFFSQFKEFIILILILAAIISTIIPIVEKGITNISLGDMVDSIVITIIIILNALFGFVQEYNAEKSIEALKKLASPKAKVLRNNREYELPAKDLVPGDIISVSITKN